MLPWKLWPTVCDISHAFLNAVRGAVSDIVVEEVLEDDVDVVAVTEVAVPRAG